MKYTITGAWRDTGEEIVVVLDAVSGAEARHKAAKKGILVASCDPRVSEASPSALNVGSKPIGDWENRLIIAGTATGVLLVLVISCLLFLRDNIPMLVISLVMIAGALAVFLGRRSIGHLLNERSRLKDVAVVGEIDRTIEVSVEAVLRRNPSFRTNPALRTEFEQTLITAVEKLLVGIKNPTTKEGVRASISSDALTAVYERMAGSYAAAHGTSSQGEGATKPTAAAERAARKRSRRAVVVACVSVIACLVVGGIFTLKAYTASQEFWWVWHDAATALVAGITVIICVVILSTVDESRCPKCKYYATAVVDNTEQLGTQEHFRQKNRTVYVREGSGMRIIANYDVPEQVRVVESHWREHCRCNYCGHRWNRDKPSTQEG